MRRAPLGKPLLYRLHVYVYVYVSRVTLSAAPVLAAVHAAVGTRRDCMLHTPALANLITQSNADGSSVLIECPVCSTKQPITIDDASPSGSEAICLLARHMQPNTAWHSNRGASGALRSSQAIGLSATPASHIGQTTCQATT